MKFISDEYKAEEKFQNYKNVTESSIDQDESKVIFKQRPTSLSSKLYQTRLQLKAYMDDDKSNNEERDYSRQNFVGKNEAKHLATSHTFGEIQQLNTEDSHAQGKNLVTEHLESNRYAPIDRKDNYRFNNFLKSCDFSQSQKIRHVNTYKPIKASNKESEERIKLKYL